MNSDISLHQIKSKTLTKTTDTYSTIILSSDDIDGVNVANIIDVSVNVGGGTKFLLRGRLNEFMVLTNTLAKIPSTAVPIVVTYIP